MGTEKRERQKAGRNARVAAAVEAQQRAERNRRIAFAVGLVVFVALVIGAVAFLRRDSGSSNTNNDTAAATTGPCVALADPLPAGAPEVPIPEGDRPTELVSEDLQPGTGDPATADSTVTVDYIGVACSTGKIFDSSYERGQPATFPLSGVIDGWSQGLVGMQPGGRRLLVIPPELGYGPQGSPPDIGPNETLIFVVELKSIGPAASSTTTSSTPSPPPTGAGASLSGETPCPAADGSSPRTTSFAQAPPMCIDTSKTYTATFDTNVGVIKVKLNAAQMPSTTNNFVVLSRYHYYDGTAIFRSDPSIDILQGGSPTTNAASDPGPGYTIPDEGGPFTYKPGQLVMARTSQPNSSGAQYFLTTGDKVSALDKQGTYLVFGEITEGLDIAQQILATSVADSSGLGGHPEPPVIINTLTISES